MVAFAQAPPVGGGSARLNVSGPVTAVDRLIDGADDQVGLHPAAGVNKLEVWYLPTDRRGAVRLGFPQNQASSCWTGKGAEKRVGKVTSVTLVRGKASNCDDVAYVVLSDVDVIRPSLWQVSLRAPTIQYRAQVPAGFIGADNSVKSFVITTVQMDGGTARWSTNAAAELDAVLAGTGGYSSECRPMDALTTPVSWGCSGGGYRGDNTDESSPEVWAGSPAAWGDFQTHSYSDIREEALVLLGVLVGALGAVIVRMARLLFPLK